MGIALLHSEIRAGWRGLVCAFGAAAVLLAAGPSRADIAPASASPDSASVRAWLPGASSGSPLRLEENAALALPVGLASRPTMAPSGIDVSRLPASAASGFGLPTAPPPVNIFQDQQGATSTRKVDNLPAPPSSLAVALSSLLTLGGWRLVRQARHVHLVCLPEWYHAGGPGQVGHATLLDLSKSLNVLPICWYQPDTAGVGSQPMVHYSRPERCARWVSSYFIPTSAPRAPPSFS